MSKLIKCKHCGDNNFFRVNKDTIECKSCGFQTRNKVFKDEVNNNNHQQEYVENLSNSSEKTNIKNDKKNLTLVKLLICIFLGHFGVHKFMEGKVGLGIVYIFTYGLFGIGILCDIIDYAKELAEKNGENQ